MAFSLRELDFLATADLDVELGLTKKTALDDARIARTQYGEFGRAVIELLTARASGKIPRDWLADSDAVQQATPLVVAKERARRIGERFVHDVTCSIGTEGYYAHGPWLGSDLDPVRLAMARHNLPGRWFVRADALQPVSRGAVVVADPARRSGGRRIKDTIPPLPELFDAWHGHEMAIKCAPGIDYSEWEGLVSVSSVAGSVKETCLYTPGLAGNERREAVIHSDKTDHIDRITDLESDDVSAGEPGRYLIDPDGAIVRAGLVRHFAHREGLWMLDERIAHLTGDEIPAGYSGFEILEQVPLKKLKAALKPYGPGSLEILVRGVDVDPDQLRKKLGLKGSRPMAVVVTRIGSAGVALICGPRVWGDLSFTDGSPGQRP